MSDLGPRLREYFDAQGPPIDVAALVEREQARARPDSPYRLRLAVGVAIAVGVIGVAGLLLFGRLAELNVLDPVIGPGHDEAPDHAPSDAEFEESGSWTVETSLGPWTWTWIPEDEGAQDLWAQAERTRPSGQDDVRQRVNRVEVPVPQVAGMTWAADEWDPWYPPVRWAGSDAATIALRKVDGRIGGTDQRGLINWEPLAATVEQSYGIEACFVWLDPTAIALVEHDASECFFAEAGDAFAVLTASLVAGDPPAVEYRDQDTGALMLRLEAADPAVSAEQLVVRRLWHLLLDDGAGFRLVEAPWHGLPVVEVNVAIGPNGFVAVGVGPSDWPAGDLTMMLHRWASSDGITWNQLGDPLALPLDGGIGELQLVGDRGRLVLLTTDDREQTFLLTSTDGEDWQRVGPVAEGGRESLGTTLSSTDFGWVLTGQPQLPYKTCEVWVSSDGVVWEQVPFQPDVETRRDADLACGIAVDDAVYVRMEWWPPPADEPPPPPGFATEPTSPETEAVPPPGCAPVAWQETGDGGVQGEGGGCGLWVGQLSER